MPIPSDDLKLEIKKMIISTLGITDLDPAMIDDEKPIFGGANLLKLDSVDAIEVIMAIQRTYGYRISDQHLAREVVRSINSIAQFVADQQAAQPTQ
jgi:acyl carrier protein